MDPYYQFYSRIVTCFKIYSNGYVHGPDLHLNVSKVCISPLGANHPYSMQAFYGVALMASLLKGTRVPLFLQYLLNFLFSSVHSISVSNAKTVTLVLPWVETHYASVKSWTMSSFYVKELLFFPSS